MFFSGRGILQPWWASIRNSAYVLSQSVRPPSTSNTLWQFARRCDAALNAWSCIC